MMVQNIDKYTNIQSEQWNGVIKEKRKVSTISSTDLNANNDRFIKTYCHIVLKKSELINITC